MRSTFHGLTTASSGLFVSQRQLDVTGHNITNANTEGYTRQRYITAAADPKAYKPQFVSAERGTPGYGVETLSLEQIRDVFLDRQFREEQTNASYWDTRAKAMYYVEEIFNTTGKNALDGILRAFSDAMQEVSKNPFDEAVRTNLVNETKRLTDVFHLYHAQLTSLMNQQDFEMVEQAKRVNNIIGSIQHLNDNILRFELGGSKANDLRDQRNLLLDELSSMMDITYTEIAFDPPAYNIAGIELTQLQIFAGSRAGEAYEDFLLVSHITGYPIDIQEDEGFNEYADTADPPEVYHKIYLNSGVELAPGEIESYRGGILQSHIDLRDSYGGVEEDARPRGIPFYIHQLDTMVETIVTEFNAIHSEGYTMPYDNDSGASGSVNGVNFFNPDGLTARTFNLSEEVLASVFNIALSSEVITLDSDRHLQTGNNENALALIHGMFERSDFPELGASLEGYYKNFIGELASEVSQTNGLSSSHGVLINSIQSQRMAVSSVDEDEEMTNLIRFQHAYNASARAITTIDEMLDKLINSTGRVGL